mgnify:CR=1 FL=1
MINYEKLEEAYSFIEEIPNEKFDLSTWREVESDDKTCNTIGCAIGHLTSLLSDDEFKTHILEKGLIIFDLVSVILFNIDYTSELWDFLFSSEWADRVKGNSKQKEQFLKRLRLVIDNKINYCSLDDFWDDEEGYSVIFK